MDNRSNCGSILPTLAALNPLVHGGWGQNLQTYADIIYGCVLSAILPVGHRALHAGLRGTNAGGGGWVGRGPTLIDLLLQTGAKVNNETFPGAWRSKAQLLCQP